MSVMYGPADDPSRSLVHQPHLATSYPSFVPRRMLGGKGVIPVVDATLVVRVVLSVLPPRSGQPQPQPFCPSSIEMAGVNAWMDECAVCMAEWMDRVGMMRHDSLGELCLSSYAFLPGGWMRVLRFMGPLPDSAVRSAEGG